MQLLSQHYQVAYRTYEPTQDMLPQGISDSKFKLIPNCWRYWAADPFLFEYDNNTYIFAELYDFTLRRGVIGYSVYKNGQFTRWNPVLTEPFHLSYPLIFSHNEEVFMLPEAQKSGKLILYKAKKFPNEWEEYKILIDNVSLVDTTIKKQDNGFIGYTNNTTNKKVYRLEFDNDFNLTLFDELSDAEYKMHRNGGNLFEKNESLIRVCQNCKEQYGDSLIFRVLNKDTLKQINEFHIKKSLVNIIGRFNLKKEIKGFHTYNRTSNFEVIDIKLKVKVHFIELFFRLLKKLGV